MWVAERGRDLELSRLVDPNTAALVLIDVQNDFCHPDGAFGRVGHDNAGMPHLVTALQSLLAAARSRQVFTVFVRATYDREVTSQPLAQHRRRLGLLESLCLEGSWGADWYSGVSPAGAPNEVILTKHRFDAFEGTPLDLYLRSNGIRTVVITGVVTAGCVESTVRRAFFLDYNVVVPRDGVAEAIGENHRTALASMQRSFATITEVETIANAWRQCDAPIAPAWRDRRARREDDKEGLLLMDVHTLDKARAASAEHLAVAARQRGIPIFNIRSIDSALARSPWDRERPVEDTGTLPGSMPPSSLTEMLVVKMRRSAFADTRLGLLLRTNDIRRVTVAGGNHVPGSLMATILDALDADYDVTVAADAIADTQWGDVEGAGVHTASSSNVAARWRARGSQRLGSEMSVPG